MLVFPKSVAHPARYLGIEPNRVMKDLRKGDVRFALCYPDVYEIGMSYLGFFLLYELLNNLDGVWCERCFAPWRDMEEHLKESGAPLSTLESRTPLSRMDIVGFSLTYELNVTNVLNMLSLSSIPVRAEERKAGPLVIGGGPLMLNPTSFERFFDIIVVGEAEGVLPEIVRTVKGLKGQPRDRVIEEVARLDGVYSPLSKKPVRRLYIKDLNASYHPVRPPIPIVGSVHNRLNIEISRGCGNGCRFCLAGYGYRPYREREPGRVGEIIEQALAGTGFEEISLLSLSAGDYSALPALIEHIRRSHPDVSVSLPSLKIGSITEEEIDLLAKGARGGFTFALETSTADLRDRLNKNINVDLLTARLPLLRRHGWRKVKLYFMIGFPWEREEDLMAVRDLIRPFVKNGIEVNLSVSPFTPKPHTPFQWLPMETEAVLREKAHIVRQAASGRGVKIKVSDIKAALVEALISRGDGRLAPLFEELHAKGVRLEAWTEFFNPSLYAEWLAERDGLGAALLGARETHREFPWDFVSTGIEKSFLLGELAAAGAGVKTADCYSSCAGCGLGCAGGRAVAWIRQAAAAAPLQVTDEAAASGEAADGAGAAGVAVGEAPSFRTVAIRYAKRGEARYIGHLDTVDILLRAIRSAGLSLRMHGKYHPKPRVSLSAALPVGVESTCEWIEIEAEGPGTEDVEGTLAARINARLPAGMRVMAAVQGPMNGLAGECGYGYLLVGKKGLDGEVVRVKNGSEKTFYRSAAGVRIKEMWLSGDFIRIVKAENRRIDGIRAYHQLDLQ
jgi:radical SAM superfamily enzyme YgiQ (UPF0313 family)